MAAYYNECDPFAAQWLRNLMAKGWLPEGEVDERSIVDVRPDDLRGFGPCHFFAGIGGWPLAGRLAGLPDDFEWWSGSCPCQPFSVAGRQKAFADDRDLWPHFARLVGERRPAIVFGEQVASSITHGWLDRSFDDLEALGYACGSAVLPACSVGAPHRRERLWFVAVSSRQLPHRVGVYGPRWRHKSSDSGGPVADADRERSGRREVAQPDMESNGCFDDQFGAGKRQSAGRNAIGSPDSLADAHDSLGRAEQPRGDDGDRQTAGRRQGYGDASECGAVGDAQRAGLAQRERERGVSGYLGGQPEGQDTADAAAPWGDAEWLAGADGKARRVKPGLRLLAHGVPNRVGRLRGYGNAIVPQAAAVFIDAAMSCIKSPVAEIAA